MKRIFLFMMAVMLLLTIAGCDGTEPLTTGEPGQTGSGHKNVQIRILEVFRDEKGLGLKVEWTNLGSDEMIFGASYAIRRKEGALWTDCAGAQEPVFPAIAYVLPAKASRTEEYYPEAFFDLSKPGTYRFTSHCTLGESDRCDVWAEFTLDERADASKSQTNELKMNPPALKLGSDGIELDVPVVGCTWHFLREDGTVAAVIGDHPDPLMMQNSIPKYAVSYSHLKLTFEKAPDTWSVTCWSAEDWAEGTAESHSVQTYDEGFLARPGAWVYAISAFWEDRGYGYYGTAEYYVYIETATGNVNGMAR